MPRDIFRTKTVTKGLHGTSQRSAVKILRHGFRAPGGEKNPNRDIVHFLVPGEEADARESALEDTRRWAWTKGYGGHSVVFEAQFPETIAYPYHGGEHYEAKVRTERLGEVTLVAMLIFDRDSEELLDTVDLRSVSRRMARRALKRAGR